MSFGTVQAEKMTTESGYSLGAGNASSFKNRIINGGMVIDQRNAGASFTVTGSQYTLDRWLAFASAPAASKFSVQQSSTAPAGFTKSLLCTSLSAYSIGAAEICTMNQIIEGYNIADLNFGTADAKSFTFSFWVRSSLTGSFTAFFANNTQSRWYLAPYTINSANTWEYKTITVPGDTSGTWLTTNGTGLYAAFQLSIGSDFLTTASTGWSGATTKYGITGQTSLVGTSGATFYVTGCQLEVGTVATSFDFRSYGTEMALCQRYYWRATNEGDLTSFGIGVIASGTTVNRGYTALPVKMRAKPTLAFSNLRIYDGTVAPSVTSFSDNWSTTNVGSYQMIATGGGLTSGRAGMLIENTGTSYLDFSAEL
jgi:hypothetical protein